jgi:hypothetical protein
MGLVPDLFLSIRVRFDPFTIDSDRGPSGQSPLGWSSHAAQFHPVSIPGLRYFTFLDLFPSPGSPPLGQGLWIVCSGQRKIESDQSQICPGLIQISDGLWMGRVKVWCRGSLTCYGRPIQIVKDPGPFVEQSCLWDCFPSAILPLVDRPMDPFWLWVGTGPYTLGRVSMGINLFRSHSHWEKDWFHLSEGQYFFHP